MVNDLFENSHVHFRPVEGKYKYTRRHVMLVKVSYKNFKFRMKTPSQERGSIKIPVANYSFENSCVDSQPLEWEYKDIGGGGDQRHLCNSCARGLPARTGGV